jgi:epsilon-lactone hydrolase
MTPRRTRRANRARSGGRSAGIRVPAGVVRLGIRELGRRALDPSLPWEVQRRRLERLTRPSLLPKGTTVTSSMVNGVPAEVVAAGPARPDRTVVHFHGGGYCLGSARTALTWAAHLSAATGCRVMLPEYRLAPEHPYPAALDDARDVMKTALSEADPGSVVLSGDSAGGGLALALLLALRDEAVEPPAGCILLSPWLDLGRDWRAAPHLVRSDVLLSPEWLEACAAAYAGRSGGPAQPSVSPLLAPHEGLPPLLIQAGSDELLAPDAVHLAASASAAGVDVSYTAWPRMWHDFALQPGLHAAADSALSQAAWFIDAVTSSRSAGEAGS